MDIKNEYIAETIIKKNLKSNMNKLQKELSTMNESINGIFKNCDDKLNDLVDLVEKVSKL